MTPRSCSSRFVRRLRPPDAENRRSLAAPGKDERWAALPGTPISLSCNPHSPRPLRTAVRPLFYLPPPVTNRLGQTGTRPGCSSPTNGCHRIGLVGDLWRGALLLRPDG
jgi:hypothetical protein